jgi:hypothetical protein
MIFDDVQLDKAKTNNLFSKPMFQDCEIIANRTIQVHTVAPKVRS